MKVYTKSGDKGKTSLIGGERVGKDDARVEAYGTVDELSAVTALLRDNMAGEGGFVGYRKELLEILNTLMAVEASLASGGAEGHKYYGAGAEEAASLERRIDRISETLRPVERFTLPGGHPLVSMAHVCRTVCRRAERAAVRASRDFSVDTGVLAYLNRLSDYFYVLGRKLGDELGVGEEYWEPVK